MSGSRSGREGQEDVRRLGLSLFLREEGGYTTVAVAVALLVSLTLVFATAAASWTASRAADVQEVADAAALAGSNAVSGFSTVAQVVDGCVLTLGLAGLTTLGAGMVMSAIPATCEAGTEVVDAGRKLLDMRREFARSAAEGMQRLEEALPAIVMANAASCVSANGAGRVAYAGTAVPFPLSSQTDYSFLEDELSGDELQDNAQRLREAAERKQEAIDRGNAARERAWRADCVDDPLCMRSRASTLAGLSGALNPDYASPADWMFGYARTRSVNYYRARLASEGPHGGSGEELARSAMRRRFYEYASEVISQAVCDEEGEVPDIHLPELPHNTAEMRQTRLYTDVVWPCSDEEEGLTIHGSNGCPGITGPRRGSISLARYDSGGVRSCPVCHMSSAAMGRVASASTNIDNGYEHYWRIVVEASREYVAAKEAEAAAERELQELSDEGSDLFQRAMDLLSVDRPQVLPAGAWGCVAVVHRGAGLVQPSELTRAFQPGVELPAGMAVSAAVLAPEPTTDGSTVMSQLFAGLTARTDFGPVGAVDGVCELWGRLLVDYGAAYGDLSARADGFLDGIGGAFGEEAASDLRERMTQIIDAAGLAPSDMRARKPVLVHSQLVLDKAGEGREALGVAREVLAQLPQDGHAAARMLAREVASRMGSGGKVTIATLTVPGTAIEIPLTVDLTALVGAS